MAGYLGARHVVAFANGTAALHGAAFAAGLGPGDEAIAPPLSFVASANCALYQGARPRVRRHRAVDVEPRHGRGGGSRADARARWCRCVSRGCRSICATRSVRDRVVVIEDACHALGARRGGGPSARPAAPT